MRLNRSYFNIAGESPAKFFKILWLGIRGNSSVDTATNVDYSIYLSSEEFQVRESYIYIDK